MKTLGLILETILEEICAGKKVFTPATIGQDELDKFQQVAKAICYADSEELVEQCQFGFEEFAAKLTFSQVMVTGGVTEKGHEFLRKRYASRHQKVG